MTEELDLPDGVVWNDWRAPRRVRVEPAPVRLFARAVKDPNAVYSSERAAAEAGFTAVPAPPTFTFVMSDSGEFPDLQPLGAGVAEPTDWGAMTAQRGLYLHGEQQFVYHRAVLVGDVLEGRMRTSKPIARQARRGPMEVTYFHTLWAELDGTPVVDELITSLFFPDPQ